MYNNASDMERLEKVVGTEMMLKICEELGGNMIYICSLKTFLRKRSKDIINKSTLVYSNANELAKQYGVCYKTILNWAKKNSE